MHSLLNVDTTQGEQVFQQPIGQEPHAFTASDVTDLTVPSHVLQRSTCIRTAQELDRLIEIE
jgi:hypothetical protein